MKPQTMIDIEWAIKHNVCYSRERLEVLLPYPWPLLQVLTMTEGPWANVPDQDRLWVYWRSEDPSVPIAIETIVGRAVLRNALYCGIPEVEAWARKWLGGDRSESLVKDARAIAYRRTNSYVAERKITTESKRAASAAWATSAAYGLIKNRTPASSVAEYAALSASCSPDRGQATMPELVARRMAQLAHEIEWKNQLLDAIAAMAGDYHE